MDPLSLCRLDKKIQLDIDDWVNEALFLSMRIPEGKLQVRHDRIPGKRNPEHIEYKKSYQSDR